MFDGQPEALPGTGEAVAKASARRRSKRKRKDTSVKLPISQGFGKILFALLAVATLLVGAWFVGFHVMVATVSSAAPISPSAETSILTGSNDPAAYPLSKGHVTVGDLANFNQTGGLHDAQSLSYQAHAAGKTYYDWYLKWYTLLAVGFLASIAAYFIGEAINNAVASRLKDMDGPDKSPATQDPEGTSKSEVVSAPDSAYARLGIQNFLGILSISLGAVAALGVFIVNEHYSLLGRLHGGMAFRAFGSGAIENERWASDPNVVRALYETLARGDYAHAHYFPSLLGVLCLTLLVPLLASGSAVEAFRLTAALLGTLPAKAAQIYRDMVAGLKARKAEAQTELLTLRSVVARHEEMLAPLRAKLDALRETQASAKSGQDLKVERLKRARDYANALKEALEDLVLKRAHLIDKQSEARQPDGLELEPIDLALNAALSALDTCIAQLEKALVCLERDIARLEGELLGLAQTLEDCAKAIEALQRQISEIESRLKADTEAAGRLEGRLASIDEEIARQEQFASDLTQPGHPSGLIVETWRGTKVWSERQVLDRRETLGMRYYGLLVGAGVLFLVGNLVSAPALPHVTHLPNVISPSGKLSFLTWEFAALNACVVMAWVFVGLGMTWLTKRFFETKGANGWLRITGLVVATGLAVGLIIAIGRLPPGLRPAIPSLPDSVGLTQLECEAGASPDTVSRSGESAYLFGTSGLITLDAKTHCHLAPKDNSQVNFYLVIGSASQEGGDVYNYELGNARALAMYDLIDKEAENSPDKTRQTPVAVYGLNLGQYTPREADPVDRSVKAAWVAVANATDPVERLKLTTAAMQASSYQRKVVVLEGYSQDIQNGGSIDAFEKALGGLLCKSGSKGRSGFAAVTSLDPKSYRQEPNTPPLCASDRLDVLTKADLDERAILAKARQEALEASQLMETVANALKKRRVRVVLQKAKPVAAESDPVAPSSGQ